MSSLIVSVRVRVHKDRVRLVEIVGLTKVFQGHRQIVVLPLYDVTSLARQNSQSSVLFSL